MSRRSWFRSFVSAGAAVAAASAPAPAVIPNVTPGTPLRASDFNALIDAVNELKRSQVNVTLKYTV